MMSGLLLSSSVTPDAVALGKGPALLIAKRSPSGRYM